MHDGRLAQPQARRLYRRPAPVSAARARDAAVGERPAGSTPGRGCQPNLVNPIILIPRITQSLAAVHAFQTNSDNYFKSYNVDYRPDYRRGWRDGRDTDIQITPVRMFLKAAAY
jgi:hypothetical protein